MNNISVGWRQTRIFTSDFSEQWYLGLLATFAVPIAERYPETPFWFSRYECPLGSDDGDTDIKNLPARFLQPATQRHFSLRFRFCPTSDEEAFLEGLFPDPHTGSHWRSHFLSYDALGEFGGPRFCTSTEIAKRLKRMSILVRLFHANSLFILDSIQTAAGRHSFDVNVDPQNQLFYSTTFFSTVHLLVSVAGLKDSKALPVFWQHPQDPNRFLHATYLQYETIPKE